MQTNKSKKILVMALIAMIVAMPMSLIAQSNGKTDGFFSSWDNDGGSRDEIYDVTANNQTFGQDLPLGGGVAILVASAAGYALLKRRKNNNTKSPKHLKHLNLLLVLAMVSVLFTQCKKADVQPQTNADAGNTINISLKVDGNSKVYVNTGTGEVTFNDGDVIYVASGGKYLGPLTRKNGVFSGSITEPNDNATMYFYFLGTDPTTSSTSFMVDISDQSKGFPVISYGTATYKPGTTKYKVTLANQCALVKFTTAENYTDIGDLVINGVNKKVTVTLSNNSFKYTTGDINIKESEGEYWAILLPNGGNKFGADVEGANGYTGYAYYESGITANDYISEGITVHEYVDLKELGKWATCNVGASTPEGWGDYYEYSVTELEVSPWGKKWLFPDEEQWKNLLGYYDEENQLFENALWVNNGLKVTVEGNEIFLPAAGYCDSEEGEPQRVGEIGYYWLANDCFLYFDDSRQYISDVLDISELKCSVRLMKEEDD